MYSREKRLNAIELYIKYDQYATVGKKTVPLGAKLGEKTRMNRQRYTSATVIVQWAAMEDISSGEAPSANEK